MSAYLRTKFTKPTESRTWEHWHIEVWGIMFHYYVHARRYCRIGAR